MRILKYLTLCLFVSFWAFAISGTIQAHTSRTIPVEHHPIIEQPIEIQTPAARVADVPEVHYVSFTDEFAVDPIIKNLTEEEKRELRLIAEAEDLIDGSEGMLWVMLTVINRIRANGGTVHSVIYAPNQYYTAGMASNPGELSQESLDMLMCGVDPSDGAKYFRTETYHSFGTPVAHVGHHYYSK
jgi:hypothetical protein